MLHYNIPISFTHIRPIHRKYELYNMEWSPENELNQMSLIAAPFGGPIAVVRDVKQFVKVAGSTSKPIIRIFTTSGHLTSTINVNRNWSCIHFPCNP